MTPLQEQVKAFMTEAGFVRTAHYWTNQEKEMDLSPEEAEFMFKQTVLARIDEIGDVKAAYGPQEVETYIHGAKVISVNDRYKELNQLLEGEE